MSRSEHAAALASLLGGRYDVGADALPWVRAFAACATGRFSDALALGQRFILEARPLEAAQLRLTVGSSLRQLGRHADALRVDEDDEAFDPLLRAHLGVSRSADAVGLGEVQTAITRLESAEDLAVAFEATDRLAVIERERVRIRAAWVAAEISLLAGAADAALVELEALVSGLPDPATGEAPWPRHVAKTSLFRGVVLRSLERAADARASFEEAASIANAIGAEPIAAVASRLRGATAP